jgi:putative ABC transport system permease protein
LGASTAQITTLLSTEFVQLVGISLLIAAPIAWWAMTKWLEKFDYHVKIEWWVFVMAGVLALVIALLTVSSQAIKAAWTNPVKSLRSE